MNANEIKTDILFLIYRDIVKHQFENMSLHSEFKDEFAKISKSVINDGLSALELLAFDNGTNITIKGKTTTLNLYVKQIINQFGTSQAAEYLKKILSTFDLDEKQKHDINIYMNIKNIATDALNLISDLVEDKLDLKSIDKHLGNLARFDKDYQRKLKMLSDYGYSRELLKTFSDSMKNSLNRNLLFCLNIASKKSNIQESEEANKEKIKKETVNENFAKASYADKIKLKADDKFLKNIVDLYVKSENKINTLPFNDYIYRIINQSDFKNDYSIDVSSKRTFIAKILDDAKNNNFKIDPLNIRRSEKATWNNFKSWQLAGGERLEEKDFKHRFYIAARPDKMYAVALSLYNEYKKKNIPFYFKINNETKDEKIISRKDNIVIYTTDEFLNENLSILHTIQTECPEIQFCEENSLIVGKIENKIGYAYEKPSEQLSSYTDLFAKALAEAFELFANDAENKNLTYNEYYDKLKNKIKTLQQDNPQKLYEVIKQTLQKHGFDLSNICCDKHTIEMFKNYDLNQTEGIKI